MAKKSKIMPLVALQDTVVLPGMVVHFDIDRDVSIQAVEYAMKHDQMIFVALQRNGEKAEPMPEDLNHVGCFAQIKQIIKLPGNLVRVLVTGEERGELVCGVSVSPYFSAKVYEIPYEKATGYSEAEEKAMCDTLKDLVKVYLEFIPKVNKEVTIQIMNTDEIDLLMERISCLLPFPLGKRQSVLEEREFFHRYTILAQVLNLETETLRIRKDLQDKLRLRIEKNQKDYVLREQMKVIRDELEDGGEIKSFLLRLDRLQAPMEIKEAIGKEIERFYRLNGSVAESAVSRTYIETLLDLPWEKKTPEEFTLTEAKEILDRDHYGMEKVKERILQYLAVRKRTAKAGGTILCLVGPPGTGKTSVAHSVAAALGKEYIRVCLGGIRDEAEIRGHRRTYIGSMPGRIVAGIRQAKVKNPLMLLDEVDKLCSDYKGDPSAALLEVLDPEQNSHFMDHYVDLPIDLSEVLFIATANTLDTIPRPLLDRMEIIELSSYTAEEKYFIAKEHLWKKSLNKNGLTNKELAINAAGIRAVIDGYTKEAGVRRLEQCLDEICRKAVWKIDTEKTELPVKVTEQNLVEFLGKKKYRKELAEKKPQVGLVRGLAWTSVGGTTLEIEVNVLEGKGGIVLTGKLGDVMKESAQTALTYVRSISEAKLGANYFDEHTLHVHIPEGAVPKDGPSAGITMATAIYSAIQRIPVVPELAMTGEVTIRGRVLPIGGLKEKLIAARQIGIKKVLVPEANAADVEELPAEATRGLNIVYVKEMKEVLEAALLKKETAGRPAKPEGKPRQSRKA